MFELLSDQINKQNKTDLFIGLGSRSISLVPASTRWAISKA
jgi:hypothetical protein